MKDFQLKDGSLMRWITFQISDMDGKLVEINVRRLFKTIRTNSQTE